MSTFAPLLLPTFISEAQPFPTRITLGPPNIPFSNNLLEHFLLFLMYLGGGEREGQYGRDGEHEPENMLAWNCHHTAVGRSEPENSQPTLARKHTPGTQHIDPGEFVSSPTALTWVVWDPSAVQLPQLPLPYSPREQWGRGCDRVPVRGWQQLAAASTAGLWLLPGLLLLLLLLMMPRRRRAE